ncbi:MAG TPA: ribosome-binding factor A [Candidatus Saccharimonadia bacterium]|jgi:ribosome-binding factor A|nr:ribosome-binding factor A [Candidatus Saccharimonadia bacterium]
MSQRVAKVESIVQQTVAGVIPEILEQEAAYVTVTRVDVSPDLRAATVWIGLLGDAAIQDRTWERLEGGAGRMQAALRGKFTMKFTPRLHLKKDTGGEYAAEIDRLLRGL